MGKSVYCISGSVAFLTKISSLRRQQQALAAFSQAVSSVATVPRQTNKDAALVHVVSSCADPEVRLAGHPWDKTWNKMLLEKKQPNVLKCNEVGNFTRRPTHALLNILRDANIHALLNTLRDANTHALLNTLRDANTHALLNTKTQAQTMLYAQYNSAPTIFYRTSAFRTVMEERGN
jgi:hypothetical protein